jgi:hypothetical protein
MEMLKAMQEKAEADREVLKGIIEANTKSMREDIKSGQVEMRSTVEAIEEKMAAIHSIQSELQETIQHEMKGLLWYVIQKTQNLRIELMETIEKTQMGLHTVKVSFNQQTNMRRRGKIASITEDITSNKRRFQSQLEEVKAVGEQGSRPTVGTNAAQPPTFKGNTSWSTFWHQFEIVAKHNQWLD